MTIWHFFAKRKNAGKPLFIIIFILFIDFLFNDYFLLIFIY